jgi:DNA-binding transcriptional LysR family regulator
VVFAQERFDGDRNGPSAVRLQTGVAACEQPTPKVVTDDEGKMSKIKTEQKQDHFCCIQNDDKNDQRSLQGIPERSNSFFLNCPIFRLTSLHAFFMPRRTPSPIQIGSSYAFDPRLDLNLFRVFDAIYSHGGISGAARALHLTQPAISHALRRLREVFNDPLFQRSGNRMVPTDLTRTVIADIRGHLQGLFGSIHATREIIPAELQTEFRLAMPDVAEATALPNLMRRLHQIAPDVRVVCREVARENFERELAKGSLDFVFDRRFAASPQLQCVHMGQQEMAIVAAEQRFPRTTGTHQLKGLFACTPCRGDAFGGTRPHRQHPGGKRGQPPCRAALCPLPFSLSRCGAK